MTVKIILLRDVTTFCIVDICHGLGTNQLTLFSGFFFLLALQPPSGVVFYSPLVGFSLLAYEVS